MPKFFFPGASLILLVMAGAGCSTTVTTNGSSTTCSGDTTVSCPRGGDGWSCDGSTRPDEIDGSLACSSAVPRGGALTYCCDSVSFPTGACGRDSTVVGCEFGSYGFSCTGSARPESQDPSLTCSSGTVASGKVDYCCLTGVVATAGCAQDSTVQGCVGASYGFSCTGNAAPTDGDPTLSCSSPTAGTGGTNLFCCQPGTTTVSSCGANAAVTGCVGGSTGYSCSGAAVPDPSLNCSQGVPGAGQDTFYCCGGTAGTCGADGTVTGCTSGALGYSCTGSVRPDDTGSLVCSSGVSLANGATGYCCFSPSATTSTCNADPSVTGCTGGSYGFACSGTDAPSDSNVKLTCGAGAAGADGNTLYCCVSS